MMTTGGSRYRPPYAGAVTGFRRALRATEHDPRVVAGRSTAGVEGRSHPSRRPFVPAARRLFHQNGTVADPGEGLDRDGLIRTGVGIDRIPERYRPVLDATVDVVRASAPAASVYAYGSVATGAARSPGSDVDVLTIGLDDVAAAGIAAQLSAQFGGLCRAVEIAAASGSDLVGESDEAYGFRVFLHHYCVHLAGADFDAATTGFPGDRRAARGLNGDIGGHHARWRRADSSTDTAELGRRIARKTLLAVAGLVSIHDATWTTDRQRAARRWSDVHPSLRTGLGELLAWADGSATASSRTVEQSIDGTVATIVDQFATAIGLWDTSST